MSKYIPQSNDSSSYKGGNETFKIPNKSDFKNNVKASMVANPKARLLKTIKFGQDVKIDDCSGAKMTNNVKRRGTLAVSRSIKALELVDESSSPTNAVIVLGPLPLTTKGTGKELKKSTIHIPEESTNSRSVDPPKPPLLRFKQDKDSHIKVQEFLPKLKVIDHSNDALPVPLKVPVGKISDQANSHHEQGVLSTETQRPGILDKFLIKQNKRKSKKFLNHSLDDATAKDTSKLSKQSAKGPSVTKTERFHHLLHMDPEIVERSLHEDKKIFKHKGTLCVLDRPLYKKMVESLAKDKLKTQPEWVKPAILH